MDLTLWNRAVPNDQLDTEVERLLEVLQSKHQQGLRQLKFIINKGVECDLSTAQGFEALSGALTSAVNGVWEIDDADKGRAFRGSSRRTSCGRPVVVWL